MKKNNNNLTGWEVGEIKDKHFPNGYADNWVIDVKDEIVEYLDYYKSRFDLNDLKCVLDIGSLNGFESVFFSDLLDSSVQIHTFEPNPESYTNVSLATETIPNIKVHNCAVSDFNGTSEFYVTQQNIGGSSLLKPQHLIKTGNLIDKINVDVVDLSIWAEKNNVSRVDAMWLDTQGAELSIFKGMGKLLDNVKIIRVEAAFKPYYHNQPNKDEIIHFLTVENGFELVDSKVHGETPTSPWEGDFLFLRNNK